MRVKSLEERKSWGSCPDRKRKEMEEKADERSREEGERTEICKGSEK